MKSKNEKLAARLGLILTKLNAGETLDIHQLAEEFAISVRTLQKDFNERLSYLEWEQAGPRFYCINRNQLGVFNQNDIERFARFASVQDLFPKLDQEFFKKQLVESIQVKGFQYETISHRHKAFKQLQQAVENHQVITFTYQKQGEKTTTNRTIEPYVLLNKNGIWYLIGLENGKQKTFCFTQMSFIKIDEKTFELDQNFLKEIESSDSISYGNQINEVIIKVNAEVAHYFTRRNLLPNQEIIRQVDNGELLISCKNIHELEIIPLVQYWIPHLVIVSPSELQEKMQRKIQQYLRNLG